MGNMRFHLVESRALCGKKNFAAEFNGRGGVVALHAGQQGGLDTKQFFGFVFSALLHQATDGLDDAVSQQNSQKSPDQGRTDHGAQHGWWLTH